MVILENKDRVIFDLPKKIVDIVHEYQTTGSVKISTNAEGIALGPTKLYEVLDYMCEKFHMEKSKITILTCNTEEHHAEYNVLVQGNHWIDNSKMVFQWTLPDKIPDLKTLGCFLGKPNWHRLIMSSWLYHNHRDQCLLTMHYDPESERHRIDGEFDKMNLEADPQDLISVLEFVKRCPVTLDEGFMNYTIGPDSHYNIIHRYSEIFLDLVVETYITGQCFFPTEKTLRPIIAKTPFVIMGPRGYLENLKRIGFRTFGQWWDEGYDEYTGYQRLGVIQNLLTEFFFWSPEQLAEVLGEMSETLNYNYQHLKKISGSDVKLVTNND
jgi:hypothetical protein